MKWEKMWINEKTGCVLRANRYSQDNFKNASFIKMRIQNDCVKNEQIFTGLNAQIGMKKIAN
jgi:hypothetical protein